MAASSDVKLLGAWPSPYVVRARIALNIKSIKYEYLEETFGTKSELLLKSNPIHKKIPVLIHGDNPICESLIIVQYIDECWSSDPQILAFDPYDRAIDRFWAAFVDDKLLALIRELRRAGGQAQKAVVGKMIEALEQLEGAYVKCSEGKAFFGGESIGFLDIALGCSLPWLKAVEKLTEIEVMDEGKVPNLVAWAERFSAEPAVKDVMPDPEKLLELFRMLIAKEQATSN